MEPRGQRVAFGAPGIAPRWSHSNKDGVGTAYSADSRVWFTLWRGVLTEAYFPTIDRPQLRDLQFLLTDGSSFFHEERRVLTAETERPYDHSLGYRIRGVAPGDSYRLHKQVISDPHLPCLLVRTRVEIRDPKLESKLRLYVLAAPHLDVGGWGNNASVLEILDRTILAAEKNDVALALGCSVPFCDASVGYVGASDGWTDVAQHRGITWHFDRAPAGNVALIGEVPIERTKEFTIGLAFGESVSAAVTTLFQSLGTPFEVHQRRYREQWTRSAVHELALAQASGDGGKLYGASRSILLAHEDKVYPGAFIASLSIPWGASKSDDDRGGYHLLWTRDLVHTALGLLAAGSVEAPMRALIYLATRQRDDGGFPQNFWVDGTAYWHGMQLDEVALPILLARRLHDARALGEFDVYPMIRRAARFLVLHAPVTQQDRWEEVSGYSPSTIASCIAALTTAATIARSRGEGGVARFLEEFADYLEQRVERWTVTNAGTLVPGIRRHYVRIRPAAVDDPDPHDGPDLGTVRLPNLPPGTPNVFPASEIVDGGFLDLVRFGVRRADDPIVLDSVRVIDAVLKVDTPFGPAWHRYNHDGYGDRADGGPFADWGQGRAWPLLTGERGHYELAAGRDPSPYLRAFERFATSTGLLPEQVWDEADLPAAHLELGRRTESATPLCWAHAEYVSLLRSAADGRVFDRIDEVAGRYLRPHHRPPSPEIWRFGRRPAVIAPAEGLRVLAEARFRLHVSDDDWTTVRDLDSVDSGLDLHYVDLAPLGRSGRRYRFTFYWPDAGRWEGADFAVACSE
jgi:glucoamylase